MHMHAKIKSWLKGRLGHGLAARSSREGGPRAASAGRAATWSPRVGHHGGALTDSLVVASRQQGLGLEHHG
jgi:hypothetical protein